MVEAYSEYHDAARTAMRDGATAHDVHRAVSKGFSDRGYHLGHVTGHSIGMTMIEHPRVGEGMETVLRSGMVLSMHPHAIAADGKACLYMQDTWLVTDEGGEPLSRCRCRSIRVDGRERCSDPPEPRPARDARVLRAPRFREPRSGAARSGTTSSSGAVRSRCTSSGCRDRPADHDRGLLRLRRRRERRPRGVEPRRGAESGHRQPARGAEHRLRSAGVRARRPERQPDPLASSAGAGADRAASSRRSYTWPQRGHSARTMPARMKSALIRTTQTTA